MRKLSQQAHPKVSVVIPIYNIEKYLAQTLDSVISQTLRDIEIICVDDGSSDQTAEILKKYADSDERIIVFRQENQGNFIAANSGIKLARGEYVSFCDHDDLMKQDQLETLYNLAKENNLDSIQIIPDVIFETSKIKRKYQGYLSYYHFDFQVKDVMSGSDLYNTISAQRVILPAPWTFFINRRLFLDNDFVYRGHILNEDEVFATKVFIYSRRMMLYADTLLYTRRIRVDSVMTSITYKEKTASYDSCAKLLQELLPTLEDAQKRKIVLERIDFLCQLSIDNRKMGQKLDKNAITLRNSEQQYFEERAKEALDAARFDKKIIALYLPAFHQIDINDKAWGFGFTEWDNVRTGEARYVGHRQPLVPHEDIGFYDLSKPEVLESQIKLAKHYGIYGFQFYYYWFDGKRVFDKPLSSLFKQKNWDFHFSICWANENWSKRWDGRDNDVIISQNYADGYELRFIKDVEDILNDPRYITIDGKPLLTIYRVDHLPDVRNFAHTVREYFREKHNKELYLISVFSYTGSLDAAPGFDAGMDFAPSTLWKFKNKSVNIGPLKSEMELIGNSSFNLFDYQSAALDSNFDADTFFNTPTFSCIMPSWDNSARIENSNIWHEATPDLYESWLGRVLGSTEMPFVFINAWNEWGEGAMLEPTDHYGYAVLNRTAQALLRGSQYNKNGILPIKQRERIRNSVMPHRKVKNPAISVIVPTHNAESFIIDNIASISNQSFEKTEIIIVDDASTDNTILILEECAKIDNRIRVIRNRQNSGAGYSRNRGLEVSNGDYLSILDSDDIFENNMLETLYEQSERNNLDIAVCASDAMSEPGKPTQWKLFQDRLPKGVFCFRDIKEINVFKPFVGWTWDKLFKASFVRNNKLEFQELPRSNDVLFTMQAICLAKRIEYVDEVLLHYRDTSNDSLSKTRSAKSDTIFYALKELKDRLETLNLFDRLEKDFRGMASHYLVADTFRLNETILPIYLKNIAEKWLKELGLCDLSESDFLFGDDYDRYRILMKNLAEV